MSATTFADSSAVRVLLTARGTAAASHAELRLVIPAPAVLRILQVLGVDGLFRIYPSPDAALAPGPLAGQDLAARPAIRRHRSGRPGPRPRN
jgi:anti-anti-sigma regulatory factor